ncbi:MAG: hypothetical protein ABSE56_17585 [Bryobacteraceae bacterium]|jgi:hypothetical protein
MPEDFNITSRIERGSVVLSVQYSPESLRDPGLGERLGLEMVRLYEANLPGPGASCVVVIQAAVAASVIVRALYTLYQKVRKQAGQVFLVGFPEDCMRSLAMLGLSSLRGFNSAESEEQALKLISASENR